MALSATLESYNVFLFLFLFFFFFFFKFINPYPLYNDTLASAIYRQVGVDLRKLSREDSRFKIIKEFI
jgi:hypothetical protein